MTIWKISWAISPAGHSERKRRAGQGAPNIEARLKQLDTKIRQTCRLDEHCKRILKIPGVGELTATAVVAAVPDPGKLRNGRYMSAWLGLARRRSVITRPRWRWPIRTRGLFGRCAIRERNSITELEWLLPDICTFKQEMCYSRGLIALDSP